jgi:hypothetical protein
MWRARRKRRAAAVAVLLVALAAANATAQFGGRRGFRPALRYALPDDFDGGFQFCRLVFRNDPGGDGGGWAVDYPRADENLSIRLAELTRVPVSLTSDEEPRPVLVRLSDPILARCPFVMMTEPGAAYFDEDEARGLREYLQKGGFLWADDFWGEYAWQFFEAQVRKALPSTMYPIVDLPLDHPIFHQMITVAKVPQIPSINAWGGPRGRTSERGPDSAVPHVRAINDARGRIMVLFTHNTDFGDSYEREGDDPRYFEAFSVNGYAFGINVIVYALTH